VPSYMYLVFGIVILGALVAAIVRMFQRLRSDRAAPAGPRTPEQKARDGRTAVIWVAALAVLIVVLLAAYALTRLPS
jgi:ABC-type Fe3+ transport system permease subunit